MKTFIPLIIFMLTTSLNISYSQSGKLDTTFSDNGKVISPIGNGGDGGYAIALQKDGKIIVGGYTHNGTDNDFALARYESDGAIDINFGQEGIQTSAIGEGRELLKDLAIQKDNKILAVGWADNGLNDDFALARYHIDGSLDEEFGNKGTLMTSISDGTDRANAILLQTDGKIIVGGYTHNGLNDDFALARYHIDGSLDTAFGLDGLVITPIGSGDDRINAMLLQDDGKIIVGGQAATSNGSDYALVRYDESGVIDITFGIGGIVTTSIHEGTDVIYDMSFQDDGKIIVAGNSFIGTQAIYSLARYQNDGALDNTFGIGGKVSQKIGIGDAIGRGLALQSDGKLLVTGKAYNGFDNDFTTLRFQSNGTLDNSFGTNGQLVTSFGNEDDEAFAIAIQPDNKIVVTGRSFNGTDNDIALVRYFSGLELIVNITDPILSEEQISIYPNPTTDTATLTYTLNTATTISIVLYDKLGRLVKIYASNKSSQPGKYHETITFPEQASKGDFYLVLSTKSATYVIEKIVKL